MEIGDGASGQRTDAQRSRVADVALQLGALTAGYLAGDRLAVDEAGEPVLSGAAIVGEREVPPGAGVEPLHVAAADGDRAAAPVERERRDARVDGDGPAFAGIVFVAVVILIFAAGELSGQRNVVFCLRQVHPGGDGEWLVGIELLGRGQIQRGLGGELQRRCRRIGSFARSYAFYCRRVGRCDREPFRRGVQRTLELRLRREPGGEWFAGGVTMLARAIPGVGNLGPQRLPAGRIFFGWQDDDRRRVGNVAVHRLLRRIAEKGRELVELFLRDRIELVIVTGGAA